MSPWESVTLYVLTVDWQLQRTGKAFVYYAGVAGTL